MSLREQPETIMWLIVLGICVCSGQEWLGDMLSDGAGSGLVNVVATSHAIVTNSSSAELDRTFS